VDLRGDLVGINTAFMAVGKNNRGMSFAIPINMARALIDQMLEFGDIRRGALGFNFTTTVVNSETAVWALSGIYHKCGKF
jgi:S1-C subfamily serine protease